MVSSIRFHPNLTSPLRLNATDPDPRGPRVLVVARAGDPLLMQGRARLIWAANTAEAWSRLGYETWLGCQGKALSFNPGPLHDLRLQSTPAEFRQFYRVKGDYRVLASPFPWWRMLGGRKLRESGAWEAQTFLPWYAFPHVGILHTRDFRLVEKAVAQNIPTIYEDHNESYHTSIRRFPARVVNHPCFRLAACTTSVIQRRLISCGIPAEKTRVAWSGLNSGSLKAVDPARLQALRAEYMRPEAQRLLTYAGGLHHCRGVEMLLRVARDYPQCDLLVLGGRENHAAGLRRRAQEQGLHNLKVLGYQPQTRVPEFLQASDALLLPYSDPAEARVTSPLKFFEYIAAARPLVCARLPELRAFESREQLAVSWCSIDDYGSFRNALEQRLHAEPMSAMQALAHHELAAHFTWVERQKRILQAAGIPATGTPERSPGLGEERLIARTAAAPVMFPNEPEANFG